MQKIIVLLSVIFLMNQIHGQNPYSADSIPAAIKEKANVIKRSEDILFEVTDVDRATYKVHQVITVLDPSAASSLFFAQHTNKYITLQDCEIKVYDGNGNQTMKYKKKDLARQASGEGLIEEGMYSYLAIAAPSYPITVEFNYQLRFDGTLFYPSYSIQGRKEAVQQSSFTLKVPKELGARFKEQRIKLQPQVQEDSKNIAYTWTVKNLPAFEEEAGSADASCSNPAILIAPNKFRIYNSYGDMQTWKDFGMWMQGLTKNLDVLPEERKLFFQNLVKSAPSQKEKIAIVYKYLQNNFRYVSIQLGIGGYQPFSAAFTDEKKYGDCKALVFYTYSVLKAIGIRSYMALVNAYYNDEPVDPSFPCNGFNHVILCVPQKSDSIWLECTSKTTDFNYLGSFTENRLALLITENGGVLVPTPRSNPESNRLSIHTRIVLNDDGSGQSESVILSKGTYREMMDNLFISKNSEQKNFIVNGMGFRQPDNFGVKKINDTNIEINLEMEKVPQFSAGSEMFLTPRIYKFCSEIMPSSVNRTEDFYFHSVMDKTDTTVYQLPEGYSIDALPRAVDKKCPFAAYSTNYLFDEDKNQLVSVAKLVLRQNRIPAENYAEVKTFFDEVQADDMQKMVIRKN